MAAKEAGINARHIKLPNSTDQAKLLQVIDELNYDSSIDGMILQLPLDTKEKVDTDLVINRIAHEKDVDGLSRENAGRLARGELEVSFQNFYFQSQFE